MVREIAIFQVQDGSEEDFIGSYGEVSDVLEQAKGSHGATLHRGIESPNTFTLIVDWDSVESHTNLMKRPEFQKFSEAITPHLSGHPEVSHVEPVG